LIDNNRPDQAAELISKQTEDWVSSTTVRYLEALVDRMQLRYDEAEAILSELHESDPADIRVGNHLALVLIESKSEAKRAKALEIADANVRRSQTSETLATLGWIQFRLGETERAETTLAVACQQRTVSRDSAFFLAQVKSSLGKEDEAKQIQQMIDAASGPFFYVGYETRSSEGTTKR
jgi:predicted Zn-dependent protease